MLKKALFVDENQIEPRTGFRQFYVKTKKVCKCFASFYDGPNGSLFHFSDNSEF